MLRLKDEFGGWILISLQSQTVWCQQDPCSLRIESAGWNTLYGLRRSDRNDQAYPFTILPLIKSTLQSDLKQIERHWCNVLTFSSSCNILNHSRSFSSSTWQSRKIGWQTQKCELGSESASATDRKDRILIILHTWKGRSLMCWSKERTRSNGSARFLAHTC